MNGIFFELYLDGSLPPKQGPKAKLAALLADRPILRTAAISIRHWLQHFVLLQLILIQAGTIDMLTKETNKSVLISHQQLT
eukprot:scaffold8939_cov122-Skeletonema_dohrnii-CCMP3373.AAC.2